MVLGTVQQVAALWTGRGRNDRQGAALSTLAAAYAEAGRFDEAIKWQTKVVELAPDSDKAESTKQLELYKAGTPYREND